jgi:hypothetical protein
MEHKRGSVAQWYVKPEMKQKGGYNIRLSEL